MARALGFSERTVCAARAAARAEPRDRARGADLRVLAGEHLPGRVDLQLAGLGSYAVAAIQSLDAPAILGVTLFVALAYVLANLLVDIVQSLVDPRVRGIAGVSTAASEPGSRRLALRGPRAVLVTGLQRDRLAAVGAVIVVLIVLMAVLAQWIAPLSRRRGHGHRPRQQPARSELVAPVRHGSGRPGRVQPRHLRRAHVAPHRDRVARDRGADRDPARGRRRLRRRLDRRRDHARDRRLPGLPGAAAGAGARGRDQRRRSATRRSRSP